MSGFAMLAIFAIAAALMYARKLPALLAVPLMALGIAAVAGAGFGGLATVAIDGTIRLSSVIVTVIFGAILSRVTIASGIAETIVTYAAEFGGDRPAVLALTLCAAVALLFTSLTGLGAIIMVGSIVLPIMLTIGVPRKTAATLFMLAFALGYIFNIAQWTFYTKTFGIDRTQMQPYAYVLGAIDLLALLAFAFVRFRSSRGSATWAMSPDEPLARKRAPLYACIAPIVPIPLYQIAHVDAIVAFALAAAYGALATAPRKAVATLVASAIRGVEDVAPAIILFMGIGMLLVATSLP
ncbi:MAG: citrate transporter, partial [Candidatus Eremiobacteraeota bacterium]|nr:citrate transporter [Candidatus Eremiobacteraeota bacterium]